MSYRREPFLLLTACFAAGIALARYGTVEPGNLWVLSTLGVLLCGIAFRWLPRARLGVLCATLLIAGAAAQWLHRAPRIPNLNADDGETVLLSGCVAVPPVFSPDRAQFVLNLTPRAAIRLSVNLRAGDPPLRLAYGDRIELPAKIRRPRNFQNPDSFDYVAYLAAQRIYWTGGVTGSDEIRRTGSGCGSGAAGFVYAIRTWALDRLSQIFAGDQQTIGLLQATLLGETSGVEKRWTNDFRVTGTYHALVISGQHVSVLASTVVVLLGLFGLRRPPRLLIAVGVAWLYALISGMSSPVTRAAGGFTLFLAAAFFFRRTRILNVLAVVGIAYLAYDPAQLFDPSFQLSFLSAAAIAAFAIPAMERYSQPLRSAVKRLAQVRYDPKVPLDAAAWRVELRLIAQTIALWTPLSEKTTLRCVSLAVRVVAYVMDAMIVSACVQFGLALPMVAYFHRLSITGLTANILVIPLLSLVVPLGFATILTGWHGLAVLTRCLLQAAEAVASWHMQFEPAWRIAAVPLALAVTFAVSLATLAWAIRHRRAVPLALAASLALFGAICWQPWPIAAQPGKLEVTAIDVSQGDSLLVVFPDKQTMLVDAGGFPGFGNMKRKPQLDLGEDVISPYLWSRHITHLDYAVLTHGHSDHMGGLAAILDNFHPRTLWIGAEPETEDWKKMEAHAAADRVKIQPLHRGSPERSIGGVVFRALAPAVDYQPTDVAVNNDSLVFDLRYGEQRVLFTGDAEAAVEEDLAASGLLQPVTLLKVGHHGSKTSTTEELLQQIRPRYAFISDGYLNQFHHPHPSVVARLEEHGVTILRTDQRGLLTFRTNGHQAEIVTTR